MRICVNCDRRHDEMFCLSSTSKTGDFADSEDCLCSPACLCEWAWRIREAQTKLSKSRAIIDPATPTA